VPCRARHSGSGQRHPYGPRQRVRGTAGRGNDDERKERRDQQRRPSNFSQGDTVHSIKDPAGKVLTRVTHGDQKTQEKDEGEVGKNLVGLSPSSIEARMQTMEDKLDRLVSLPSDELRCCGATETWLSLQLVCSSCR
jgi:hypothetical protein